MRRSELVVVAGLTALLAVGFVLLATPEYRFMGDTEHYVGLANAIARGEGASLALWRQTQYPPGFPLLLAPASWISDGSFTAIGRWSALLACAVFPLTWLWAKRRGDPFALAIAILTVFSYQFLDSATDNPMSEAAYMAVSLGVLLWAEQRERSPGSRPGWGWTMLGCGLLIALPAVRTVGMAGVIAGMLLLAARALRPPPGSRRFKLREWLPVLAGAGFLLAWLGGVQQGRGGYLQGLTVPFQPSEPGGGILGQLVARPWYSMGPQLVHAGELLTGGMELRPTWYTPALLGVALLVAGWWENLRRKGRFAALYLAGFVGITLVWGYEGGTRLLLPALPLLWVFLFEGVRQTAKAIESGRSWIRITGLVWGGLALVGLSLAYRANPAAFRAEEQAGVVLWGGGLLVLLFAWKPLVRLAGRAGARAARVAVLAGTGLFALVSMYRVAPRVIPRAQGTLPLWGLQKSLGEATRWINANLPGGAVILTSHASRLRFATGRRAVRFPDTLDPRQITAVERSYHPQYLFINEAEDTWAKPSDVEKFAVAQLTFGARLRRIYHFEGGSFYAFVPAR